MMPMRRRTLLMSAFPLAAASMRKPASAVDHLVLGTANLDEGIAWLARQAGVRPALGGVHPGRGTRNALLSLGNRQYLELLAPDPAQQSGGEEIVKRLLRLTQPKLIGWAASTSEAAELAAKLRAAGENVLGPEPGSRRRQDGRLLEWQSVMVGEQRFSIVPFFIQWAPGSVHPSQDSPSGCKLNDLRLFSPQPAALRQRLAKMAIDAAPARAAEDGFAAELSTPGGPLKLT